MQDKLVVNSRALILDLKSRNAQKKSWTQTILPVPTEPYLLTNLIQL